MITTKQEKDKTTIIISRKLKKTELARVVDILSYKETRAVKTISKKRIQELADEVTAAAWDKLKKKRKFKWL